MRCVNFIETDVFAKWIFSLRDGKARIDRLVIGNPGDVNPVSGGISEMRIGYSPGYRVYFLRKDSSVIVLPAGGDKRPQRRTSNGHMYWPAHSRRPQ